MGEPSSVDLDDTTGCPLGDRCEGCATAMGLEVCTAHAMGGVLCLTLCRGCEAPAWGPTTVALRTLAHAGHLGIDTDQMAARLKRAASGCLWCGASPAPHVVFGDPLCDGCYDDHRAEGGVARPAYLEIRRVAGHVRDRDSVHRAGEATP